MISRLQRYVTAALLLPQILGAWDAKGHRLIARIAESRLNPITDANVRLVLGGHTMAEIAGWADAVRRTPEYANTYNWHFVDIPATAYAYDKVRDCPPTPRGDCIVEALAREWDRLRGVNPANPSPAQVDALKFLVHFLGDLHQPFHAIGGFEGGPSRGGRGGHQVPVSLLGSASDTHHRPWDLHSVWDGGLMFATRSREPVYLGQLLELAPPTPEVLLDRSTVARWAMESHDLALQAYVREGSDLGRGYCEVQARVMDRQIELAGVRTAAVLNSLLGAP